MNKLLLVPLMVLAVGACVAEELTLPKNTVMRADRSLMSLKAGTVVEVVERGDKTMTIRYKGQTGTIPMSSVAGTNAGPAVAATPVSAKPAPAASTPRKSVVVDNPQSTYGNLVKKAEKNAAKHDDNLVKPANQVTDDNPSK